MDPTALTLTAGDVVLTVDPDRGGRLASLVIGGLDVLGTGGDRAIDWGAFVMAPWAGRVRDGVLEWDGQRHELPTLFERHALHGVCFDRPWQVTSVDATSVELRCAFDDRWPWDGEVRQRLRLGPDSLEIVVEVHAGDEAMPAWCGVHPWFRRRLARGDALQLAFDAGGMLATDDAAMPTGEVVDPPAGPWDDCFVDVVWPVVLRWPGALRLAMEADTGYAVVYDGKDTAVAVEPQTAPPDAAALGSAATVRPGEPLVLATSWSWQQEH